MNLSKPTALKKICIIKAGTAPDYVREKHGDFHRHFLSSMKLSSRDVEVISDFKSKQFPFPRTSGVIITGSPANVTDDEPWMIILANWIRELVDKRIPILGICFGHQILAHALGGKVDFHPKGMEIGTVPIQLTETGQSDPILGNLPKYFKAHEIHSQRVVQLPTGAKVLASNNFESHQAIAYVENLVWGLQFHPEFNAKILRSYIEGNIQEFLNKGFDVSNLLQTLEDQNYDAAPLLHFIDFCFARQEVPLS